MAAPQPPLNWNTATTSALVPISTHSMYLRATGPPRTPGTPAIILECGLGTASSHWAAIARQISPFARIYTYDRSGLDHSEPSPLPRTAENIANELLQLLKAAKVEPPYILLAHSYGGVLIREFLELLVREKEEDGGEDRVVGAVFEECNMEETYKSWPEDMVELMGTFWEGIDQDGILDLENRHSMAEEEWAGRKRATRPEEDAVGGEEMKCYMPSCDTLGEKRQLERRPKVLGDWAVSVIKGDNEREMRTVFEAAVKEGRGTEEQRASVDRWLGKEGAASELRSQERQLELSTRGRLVRAWKSGHEVHVTEPELIVEEVKWVLGVWKEKREEKEKALHS